MLCHKRRQFILKFITLPLRAHVTLFVVFIISLGAPAAVEVNDTQLPEPCPKNVVDLGLRHIRSNPGRYDFPADQVESCYCAGWSLAQSQTGWATADAIFDSLNANPDWYKQTSLPLQLYYFWNRAQVKSNRLKADFPKKLTAGKKKYAQTTTDRWQEYFQWHSELSAADKSKLSEWDQTKYRVERATASLGNAKYEANKDDNPARAVGSLFTSECKPEDFGPDAILLWINCMRGYPRTQLNNSITIDQAFIRDQIGLHPETKLQWEALLKSIESLTSRRDRDYRLLPLIGNVATAIRGALPPSS